MSLKEFRSELSKVGVLFLFLALFLSICSLSVKTNAQSSTEILSHTSYISTSGYYHIVGEVRNGGSINIIFVKVTSTFYDGENQVIGTSFAYTALRILKPGIKSPFEIIFMEKTQIPKIASYSLNVEYQGTTSDPSLQLVIVSHNNYTSPAGIMHIVGEVENQGDTTRYVKVIATGYDENSTVVAYAFSYTNPEDLSNTQKAPFDVIILSDRAPLVENYILIVESSDYQSVMIPEFSNIYFVLLFSLLFLAYGKKFLINKMLLK